MPMMADDDDEDHSHHNHHQPTNNNRSHRQPIDDDDDHDDDADSFGSDRSSASLRIIEKSAPGPDAHIYNLNHHHHQQHLRHQHQQYHQHQLAQQNHQFTANLLLARTMAANSLAELADMKSSSSASATVSHSAAAATGYLLPCPLCDTPLEPRAFRQHLDRHYPRDSPVCPVLQCGRRFAHPNSVRNHMRIKHTLQWAKMKAMRSSGGPFTGMAGDFK